MNSGDVNISISKPYSLNSTLKAEYFKNKTLISVKIKIKFEILKLNSGRNHENFIDFVIIHLFYLFI